MSKHYLDYFWQDGLPCGLSSTVPKGITYKIISDPYHKRISIEKYMEGDFVEVIYDSALFDFRHLRPELQTAWQKTVVSQTEEKKIISHIRNQDDRLILIEEYFFENQRCRECRTSSPQGVLVSVQKISYQALNDSFNGVILYDSNAHPVLLKRYQIDKDTHEFADLIEENWKVSQH